MLIVELVGRGGAIIVDWWWQWHKVVISGCHHHYGYDMQTFITCKKLVILLDRSS